MPSSERSLSAIGPPIRSPLVQAAQQDLDRAIRELVAACALEDPRHTGSARAAQHLLARLLKALRPDVEILENLPAAG